MASKHSADLNPSFVSLSRSGQIHPNLNKELAVVAANLKCPRSELARARAATRGIKKRELTSNYPYIQLWENPRTEWDRLVDLWIL
jgi:hypothetical protein